MLSTTLLAKALLAYSVHEHQEGYVSEIDVKLGPESFTVQDNGRGMGLDRGGYVENLMGSVVASVGALQLHGIGLSLIAASSPLFVVESTRKGGCWEQAFTYGVAVHPPRQVSRSIEAGTRTSFKFEVGAPEIDLPDFMRQVEFWRQRNIALVINVHQRPAA